MYYSSAKKKTLFSTGYAVYRLRINHRTSIICSREPTSHPRDILRHEMEVIKIGENFGHPFHS
jgi:hypothetical protein